VTASESEFDPEALTREMSIDPADAEADAAARDRRPADGDHRPAD
jgi:hypothetical protein